MRLVPRLYSSSSQLSSSSSSSGHSDDSPSRGNDEMTDLASRALDHLPTRDERPAYETPPADGSSPLLSCPPEVLVGIFGRLDRGTFTTCLRLCRPINELLETNTELGLRYTLQCHSLTINPNSLVPSSDIDIQPPAPGKLLDELRERVTRFLNFTPKAVHEMKFKEPDGRLYEYIEGVLLRGVTARGESSRRNLPKDIAVYDLRKLGDWEDVPGSSKEVAGGDITVGSSARIAGDRVEGEDEEEDEDEEGEGADVRTIRTLDFRVTDFAVDPGQDLLVVVETRTQGPQAHTMHLHLLSLATHEPHPRAKVPVLDWPVTLLRKSVALAFQICDDGIYILSQNMPEGPSCHICGWQWTTGRLAVTLRAPGHISFETFVLLTPWSFAIPTIITHLDQQSAVQDVLNDASDLSWTHHIHIYAFPPFHTVRILPNEPNPPPHTAVHVKTIDLPRFHVDLNRLIPPPRLSIRADPPPRHTPPTHPEGRQSPFLPDPKSGIFVIDIYGQYPGRLVHPHYQIIMLKSLLLPYLPSPDSSLLTTAFPRPAAVVAWEEIAPKVRMIIPETGPSAWVCYVYQNRFVSEEVTDEEGLAWSIHDFDPLRVRKVQLERLALRAEWDATPHIPRQDRAGPAKRMRRVITDDPQSSGDSELDGVFLYQEETVLRATLPLLSEIRTGSEFPYITSQKDASADFEYDGGRSIMLLDESRVVVLLEEEDENGNYPEQNGEKSRIMVTEF